MKATPVRLIFDCLSGNSGLTEEFIYTKLAMKEATLYEVLSSSTTGVTKLGFIPECVLDNGKPLRVFKGKHGVLVARNGRAGQMTYLKPGAYTINDHAYILSLREDFKNQMGIMAADQERRFLLWFIYAFQEQISSFASKTANATWNKSDFLKMNIPIPPVEAREGVTKLYEDCIQAKERLGTLFLRVKHIVNDRALFVAYHSYQAKDIPISKVLDYHGGNSGLTEKEIYQRMFIKGQRYEVLSASTSEETKLGTVPKGHLNRKELKVLDDQEGILVIRKGKAGVSFYYEKGKYALTDDAYFLTIKKDCGYDISLKWLIAQYRQTFFDYSSSSDNGTWNMTGFFKDVFIDIPSYEEQLKIAEKYDYVQLLKFKIDNLIAKIDVLFTRQVVS